MEEVKATIEQLNKAFEDFKGYHAKELQEIRKSGESTAETRAQVDAVNQDITKLNKSIDEMRAQMELMRLPGKPDSQPEKEKRHNDLVLKYIRYGMAGMEPQEVRGLNEVADSEGGIFVSEDMQKRIIMQAYNMEALRRFCDVYQTSKNSVRVPTMSKPAVAWGKPLVATTESTVTAGYERAPIHFLRSLYLLQNDWLDDMDFDVVSIMTSKFGLAIAEAEDNAFAAGVGDDQPKGIMTDTRVTANFVISGVTSALSDATHNGVDAMIGAMMKPKAVYRMNGTWVWSSATETEIRKLKDGNDNYLWQPTVASNVPNTFLGRPVAVCEYMPSIGAGTFPILFGDLRQGYAIFDRAGISIQRNESLYMATDQVGIFVKKRVGGQVMLPEALACVKIAAS